MKKETAITAAPSAEQLPAAITECLAQQAQMLQALGRMMQSCMERMETMERQMMALRTITRQQALELSRRMSARAKELAHEYRVPGSEKMLTNAIRRDVRAQYGIYPIRDLCASDYQPACDLVAAWDDYDVIMDMKKGAVTHGKR